MCLHNLLAEFASYSFEDFKNVISDHFIGIHGSFLVRLSPTVMILQDGENICPFQVVVEAQLNITIEEIEMRIHYEICVEVMHEPEKLT